jgi:hypothetical protein
MAFLASIVGDTASGLMGLTRGWLIPAVLKNTKTNEEVKFMFNPSDYKLSKSITYTTKPLKGKDVPAVEFQQGEAIKMTLKLLFDTVHTGKDVRKTYTAKLWKMVKVVPSQSADKKSTPPPVLFTWGSLTFKAVITSIDENVTVFAPDGTPLRSEVTVSLQEYSDAAQAAASGSTTAVEGDRIDHVAASTTGSASTWRTVAGAAGLNNPLTSLVGMLF